MLAALSSIARTTLLYLSACWRATRGGQGPAQLREALGLSTLAAVHCYSLCRWLALWDAPHYRALTFAHDCRENLRNVAVPGTGAQPAVQLQHQQGALPAAASLVPAAST
jgi:hypothetical protein